MMLSKILDQHVARFWDDESGAVSVDWVVLAAGVVALALVVSIAFTPQIAQLAGETISAGMALAIGQP